MHSRHAERDAVRAESVGDISLLDHQIADENVGCEPLADVGIRPPDAEHGYQFEVSRTRTRGHVRRRYVELSAKLPHILGMLHGDLCTFGSRRREEMIVARRYVETAHRLCQPQIQGRDRRGAECPAGWLPPR